MIYKIEISAQLAHREIYVSTEGNIDLLEVFKACDRFHPWYKDSIIALLKRVPIEKWRELKYTPRWNYQDGRDYIKIERLDIITL